jgi:histidine triad (HIT) family protein
MAADCLFCKMATNAFPVDKLYEDGLIFAIRDINPRAPIHVMLIPRQHIASARELDNDHGPLLAHMFRTAASLANDLEVGDSGYRLTFNVGEDGGQTIYHLHLHLLGGRHLGPEG